MVFFDGCRPKWHRRSFVAFAVLLGGCGIAEGDEGGDALDTLSYADGFSGSWSISIKESGADTPKGTGSGVGSETASNEWIGRFDHCLTNPAIADAWRSADSPSDSPSTLSVVLIPEATEADARRVAACVDATLVDAHATVKQPS